MIGSGENAGGQHSNDRRRCHFIEEMLVAPARDRGPVRDELRRNGLSPQDWGDDELRERLDGLQDDDLASIRVDVDLIKIGNPHAVAGRLRSRGGFRASPVHEIGHLSHSRVMSGDGPYETKDEIDGKPVGVKADIIAVVDSGIVEEDHLPEWMSAPSVEAEDRDREVPDPQYRLPASHGTFVVSQLRRSAPEHAVWLARARPRELREAHGPRRAPFPTTELDVVAALGRLKRRFQDSKREPVALNLSLGAHIDDPYEDDFLLAVKLALASWRREFETCPIFAAGGNVEAIVDPNPVYPGAFAEVVAVGALDDFGVEVVWNSQGHLRDGSWRGWINQRAYGVDRVGLSGNPALPVVRWSGSSFATAEATATSV